jgi:hypothetical protein
MRKILYKINVNLKKTLLKTMASEYKLIKFLQNKALEFKRNKYEIDQQDYHSNFHNLVDFLNYKILSNIVDKDVSLYSFETKLEAIREKNPIFFLNIGYLKDKDNMSFSDLLNLVIDFESAESKRGKLKVLKKYIIYTPEDPNIEEPIGSDTE